MNRSTWAGVVVLGTTICSSLMIAAPVSAADGPSLVMKAWDEVLAGCHSSLGNLP